MHKDYENWLRVVGLIDIAGKRLCYEILHVKEQLPSDGGQLYCKLECHKNNLHYQCYEEILCPPNKVIDEKKFDLLIYTTIIYYMFGDKYDKLLDDVGDMRDDIFHMEHESICKADFEQLWNNVCCMLQKHEFHDMELLKTLKTCDPFSAEQGKGILEFISFL